MSAEKSLDHLTCDKAVERLQVYLDKELAPDEESAVQSHLELCQACFQHFTFEEKLLGTIREQCRTGRAPESLRRKVSSLLDRL